MTATPIEAAVATYEQAWVWSPIPRALHVLGTRLEVVVAPAGEWPEVRERQHVTSGLTRLPFALSPGDELGLCWAQRHYWGPRFYNRCVVPSAEEPGLLVVYRPISLPISVSHDERMRRRIAFRPVADASQIDAVVAELTGATIKASD